MALLTTACPQWLAFNGLHIGAHNFSRMIVCSRWLPHGVLHIDAHNGSLMMKPQSGGALLKFRAHINPRSCNIQVASVQPHCLEACSPIWTGLCFHIAGGTQHAHAPTAGALHGRREDNTARNSSVAMQGAQAFCTPNHHCIVQHRDCVS
eukprot:1139463-Pelagomonas_calceolata.AAC.2